MAASAGVLATPPADAAPGERVRVIVELDKRANAEGVVKATAAATQVRTTEVLPYLIMEVPESAISGLRRNPHVRAVSKDKTSAPPLASCSAARSAAPAAPRRAPPAPAPRSTSALRS